MVILTADEIRAVETKCFEHYSTEAELMLRAGTACFEAITSKYDLRDKHVSVLCGNGKNAGDGFVIARLLYCRGVDVSIIICDKMPTIAEPLEYYNQAISSGVPVEHYSRECLSADYLIDTIFGIGFHGEARAPFDTIFAELAKAESTIIAVDTPSGTDATTGRACKNAVRANFTIAISTLKYCHILPPSNALCGETQVVDIGIPKDCYDTDYAKTIEFDDVKACLPKVDKNANKGTLGHQLNICGSYKMFGAGVIAAQSAIRTGAGLVKLVIPRSAYALMAAHLIQPIFSPVSDNAQGTFSADAVDEIIRELPWADSIVIGCGIGCNEDTAKVTCEVLKYANSPIILDADGINSITMSISILKDVKARIVLTPHPGEMSRLISKTAAEVQEDRIGIAKRFAKENHVILVLKGANTVVTDGEEVFVNLTGNSSMAMGGTGDMLSGMIGAFAAQGIALFDAVKCAVYIHGACGDAVSAALSRRGITVSDMIEQLGALMSDFE